MKAWRQMAMEEMEAVSAISDAVHGRYTEPRAVYAERLALYPAGCLVWESDGAVAGYLVSHPWCRGTPPALGETIGSIPVSADSYCLHDLALLPSERGTGAGAAATRIAIDRARSAGMEDIVLVAVNGADRYWRRQGFVPVPDEGITATLRASYGPEALYMQLSLTEIRT